MKRTLYLIVILILTVIPSFAEIEHKHVDSKKNIWTDSGERVIVGDVVFCDPELGLVQHPNEKIKLFEDGISFREAVERVGPGWMPKGSGTGGVKWYFQDGTIIDTVLWPKDLDEPLTYQLTVPDDTCEDTSTNE